jgi:hypothetical protein
VRGENAGLAVAGIGTSYVKALQHAVENRRLRQRPSAEVWSPLEYATHMRDVLLLFTRRTLAILSTDTPELEVVSHDQMVATGGYNRLDALIVGQQIQDASQHLAGILNGLVPADFARRGLRDGEERTVLEIAQRAAHESRHHLLDMARGLAD